MNSLIFYGALALAFVGGTLMIALAIWAGAELDDGAITGFWSYVAGIWLVIAALAGVGAIFGALFIAMDEISR